jgi:putative salt-induced outer membrane protein YdiY
MSDRWLRLALLLVWLAAPAGAETYELKNGDKISGEVLSLDDEKVVLEHPVFGKVEIPLVEIAPAKGPRPGLFGTPLFAGWTRTLKLGADGERGESDNMDVLAALDLDYEDETLRWKVDARYSFSAAERETTKNSALLDVSRAENFDDSRWFWLASGRWDWDEFRSWDHRLTLIGALGYELVDRETFELRLAAGPTLTREFGGTDAWLYEAVVGVEAKWKLAEKHTIEASNRFFQAVNEDSPYRNQTDLKWKWQLTQDPGLSLNVGIENEYESDPLPGVENNDLKYFTSLGIDF